jgi:hypothetical protein
MLSQGVPPDKTRDDAIGTLRDIKRRWNSFLARGLNIRVNGHDVASFSAALQGEEFKRSIRLRKLGKGAVIDISLLILKEPSDLAAVSVTHRGQANFQISDVPLFEGNNAFTQGMPVSPRPVPISASCASARHSGST